MSQNLAASLARASDVAGATGAADVSLEHVLLALCDDPDAEAVLMASRVDVARLKSETAGYLGSLPQYPAGGGLGVAPALSRILEAAAAAARGGRKRDINGAIVLAAIVGDGKSAAAQILQAHGLTFDEAIRALQAALAAPSRDAIPDFKPADDVLARARERVQSRSAPGLRDIMNDLPRTQLPPPPPQSPAPMLPPTASAPEIEEHAAQPQLPDGAPDQPVSIPDSVSRDSEPASGRIEPEFEATAAPEGAFESAQQPSPQPVQSGPRADAAHGYVYPAEQQAQPPPSSPQGYAPPQPASFDFARPVPIATPPPIPPPIPHMQPGQPAYPGFARGPEPSFAPPPMGQPMAQPPMPPAPAHGGGYPPGGHQSYPPFDGQMGRHDAGPMVGAPPPPQQMRAPSMPSPSMPSMAPPSGVSAAPPPQPARNPRAKVETGQLAENIPRGMRVGVTERVEVRIAKAAAKAITEGLDGNGVAWRHEVTITQAMSVRLRAPDGGFFIETVSPETQWIENQLGFASDDFASWRFLITPQARGWTRLQIVVSARTIGADGMAAETALPDQVVEVKVRTNYKRTFLRWSGWILAAIAGGALAKFGEGGLGIAQSLIQKLMQ